ncbi:aldo/keto reductase [Vibrio scophthalmi]|uniref:aldo/keto reductase n=1 Tax=Vibrio scophthalmi TaxID=45658 RepID=UPI003872EA54
MKIALGTAQFGLDYGVTNSSGQVSIDTVGSILAMAEANGVSVLDTAIAYGNSEETLGHFELSNFKVISKIPSMTKVKASIEQLVCESLARLNIPRLYGLMLHDESDAVLNEDTYLAELQKIKEIGLVEKVGVSFYSPQKALECIQTGLVDIIQIPASQLDCRFEDAGVYSLADKFGVEVHVRSIFLQGLLALKDAQRPTRFQGHSDLIRFDDYANSIGLSPFELALMYLHDNKSVDYGVLGCTNIAQFAEMLEAYTTLKTLTDNENPQLSSTDDILLNPSKW